MNKDLYNELIINDAVDILNDDGVIVLPTDTVYGLACRGDSEIGKNKIYRIKERNLNKKLPIIVDTYERLFDICEISEEKIRRIRNYFPGELTVILNKKNSEETVAVRMINNEIVNKIIERLDCYLYLTSANKSNEECISDISELIEEFEGKIDMIIMGSKMKKVNSTIVDMTGSEIKLVREGSVPFEEVLEVYNRG